MSDTMKGCDYYDGEELCDEYCPHAKFTATRRKGEWVELAGDHASAVLDSFRILRSTDEDDGWTTKEAEAAAAAIEEHREAMACWVGLGSCGRGWCKHS